MRFPILASVVLCTQLAAAESASVTTGTVKGQEEIASITGSREISGVFPHLTAYSQSRADGLFSAPGHEECGIGGLVPWASKLWMVTYAPHMPKGSQHKLYEIDDQKNMILRAESLGGTPAGRMVHAESKQLFIGHYAISDKGELRVISIKDMPGRVTAWARHLSDPANKVYMVDMEDMIYEVEVHSLKPTLLFKDPIPGYHGKGAYLAQGKLVVANNGESGSFIGGLDSAKDWQVSQDFTNAGPEDRGCLATYDGKTWQVIERRQYTEVTGPEGISPTAAGDKLPLWTIGWDKRSLRLQVLQDGQFHLFLLPKGCLNNDAKHGWFTEWPRIRDIGQDKLLMDMHGLFFDFPKDFAPGKTGGLTPIGRHLRYIPDFCKWNEQLVLGCDEASIQGNPLCGQPQSNLWFGSYQQLKKWGETSADGSIWADDAVKADEFSAPFLINGFSRRLGHFSADAKTRFDLEIDLKGDGQWTSAGKVEVEAGGSATLSLPQAQWIRVKSSAACKASLGFLLSNDAKHEGSSGRALFAAIPDASSADPVSAPLLFPNRINRNLSVLSQGQSALELNELSLEFAPAAKEQTVADAVLGSSSWGNKKGFADPKMPLRDFLKPEASFSVDAASVILKSEGKTLRLPKGDAAYDKDFAEGAARSHREVLSERLLANIHGSFYEVPFWIVGQPALYTKMKPVCTHNKKIMDYATWRGLLVLSGVKPAAPASNHVVKSADGKTALWLGAIDDLWQLGKPVGQGGPWKDSAVKAGAPSDAYLMNGYDKKNLKLVADQDCSITLEADFDLLSGFHKFQTFTLKAGQELSYDFPGDFAAHWVRVVCDKETKATAWFTYR